MTEAQARELISAQFAAQWPVESDKVAPGGVPYMLDNELAVTGDAFASLSIRMTTGRGQTTAGPRGNRRWERAGAIYVRIWTAIDQGANGGSALCDAARAVLEGISLPLLTSGEPVTIFAGDSQPTMTDARWWMSTVIFRFVYTEIR